MIDDLWYKNTVIYSLDLETFMDANGDGVGDFEGLMRRLDYLQALGIGTIWLAPFQPTPNKDNGYDIFVGGWLKWCQPDCADAERLQVIEAAHKPFEVTHAIAIGIHKSF